MELANGVQWRAGSRADYSVQSTAGTIGSVEADELRMGL